MLTENFTERDICTKFILPALTRAGWDVQSQIREEVSFTAGKIIVQGRVYTRGKRKRADFILYYKYPNIPLAVIEAKEPSFSIRSGIQQALDYAKTLDVPFVFSSNGSGFLFHDKTQSSGEIEKEISLLDFPSPEELWNRYKQFKKIESDDEQKIVEQDYYIDTSPKQPRYYQVVAINRTVEAIAKGMNRILLVMATGTGKTYVAFQIIWRLWKSGKKKRILFLADRNALLDQTRRNDFKHFKDKMTVVRNHKVDKSYEIYLALYQGLSGTEEEQNIFRQFSPDFFDLIVIDECHRGSAADDARWREILEYFGSATQIGLTATPRETKEISNSDYFGEPIYTYSLKQGIEDGFLAPYKVIRIGIDRDLEGWTPERGKLDIDGNEVESRQYNTKDYDRTLVIEERTNLVARKVSEFLRGTNRFDKTIVFCVDIDHAERMRSALSIENADLVSQNHKYIMQITGDNEEGKRELDNFIDPEQAYPVIATTSKLMTTGVDAQTCKLIVLDSNINSMTEFKQIIGRGTRINEAFGKFYFTIMDFRNVTNLFSDPDFDGEPVSIYQPPIGGPIIPPEPQPPGPTPPEPPGEPFRKVRVRGVEVRVLNERVQYYGKDGRLITESLRNYARQNILSQYKSLDEFLTKWNAAEKKQVIIQELLEQGILFQELQELVGQQLDPFDLVAHIAFDKPALTRKERANNVKKRNYFTKYGEQAKKILELLLDKYEDNGIVNIENTNVLELDPIKKLGTPAELVKHFGGLAHFKKAVKELENELYKSA